MTITDKQVVRLVATSTKRVSALASSHHFTADSTKVRADTTRVTADQVTTGGNGSLVVPLP